MVLPELPVQPAASIGDQAPPEPVERLIALRAARAHQEADFLLGSAARRPPHEVDAIACALAWRGMADECDRLFAACAAGPIPQTAELLRVFADLGRGWAVDLLTAEFGRQSAMDGSTAQALDALAAFGLGALIEPLLAGACSVLAEARVLALAESVDAGGREAAAYTLYAHAAHLLADRWPADRTAGLLRRMLAAGAGAAAERIFEAVVEMCGPYPSSTAYLARALTAEGLGDPAKRLLSEVAPRLADAELETLAAYLEAGRLNALAVHALSIAALDRPARTVIGYCERLYQHNHPQEAASLLVTVAAARPGEATALIGALRSAQRSQWADQLVQDLGAADPAISALVAATLWRGGGREDARTLLGVVAREPLETAASVFAGLDPASGGPADALAALLLAREAQELAQLARALRTQGRPGHADLLLGVLAQARPDLVGPVIGFLASARPPEDAARLLHRFALTAGIGDLAALVARLDGARDPQLGEALAAALAVRTDLGEVLGEFRRAGLADHLSRYLGRLGARMTAADLVTFHDNLAAWGLEADADLLLAGCATRADFGELNAHLHRLGKHALAYRLVELRGEFIS
jgi:hypothetical protein